MNTTNIPLDYKQPIRFEDIKPEDLKGPLAGKAWKLEQARDKIKWAQYILWILAGLNILALGLKLMSQSSTIGVTIFSILFIVILIGSAIMAKSKPVPALGAAIGFYLILELLGTIGGIPLAQGILWKLVIITFLGIGLFNGIKAENTKKEILAAINRS